MAPAWDWVCGGTSRRRVQVSLMAAPTPQASVAQTLARSSPLKAPGLESGCSGHALKWPNINGPRRSEVAELRLDSVGIALRWWSGFRASLAISPCTFLSGPPRPPASEPFRESLGLRRNSPPPYTSSGSLLRNFGCLQVASPGPFLEPLHIALRHRLALLGILLGGCLSKASLAGVSRWSLYVAFEGAFLASARLGSTSGDALRRPTREGVGTMAQSPEGVVATIRPESHSHNSSSWTEVGATGTT